MPETDAGARTSCRCRPNSLTDSESSDQNPTAASETTGGLRAMRRRHAGPDILTRKSASAAAAASYANTRERCAQPPLAPPGHPGQSRCLPVATAAAGQARPQFWPFLLETLLGLLNVSGYGAELGKKNKKIETTQRQCACQFSPGLPNPAAGLWRCSSARGHPDLAVCCYRQRGGS